MKVSRRKKLYVAMDVLCVIIGKLRPLTDQHTAVLRKGGEMRRCPRQMRSFLRRCQRSCHSSCWTAASDTVNAAKRLLGGVCFYVLQKKIVPNRFQKLSG